ncbi:MAG: oligosaccharide repeat unit polymerase [Deltaproteobacteria bacterium]|nr:oligosaccharide repeat unit polymerase [Deltaproteobacteria bacterium]
MPTRELVNRKSEAVHACEGGECVDQLRALLHGETGVAALIALVATTAVMLIPSWSSSDYFTTDRVLTIGVLQFACLLLPVRSCMSAYRRHKDFFNPYLIAAMTFAVFHVLMNPIVIYGLREIPEVTQIGIGRDLGPAFSLYNVAVRSYLVLIVSWISFIAGYRLLSRDDRHLCFKEVNGDTTDIFLMLGICFVLIGWIANYGIMEGLSAYLGKMLHFYSRSTQWIDANIHGGMKWSIMLKFLPVGLVILVLGTWVRNNISNKRFVVYLMLASLANVILNCATGGRGRSLTVFFFSVILINKYVSKFTLKRLVLYFLLVVSFSFLLGILRGMAFYDTFDRGEFLEILGESARIGDFIVKYLTNTMGTLVLADETMASGIIYGKTAFAGLTGLLGGATPLTTQQEVFQRLSTELTIGNPRYGPPGELYFNFGMWGVVIGFVLMGLLVSVFSRAYVRAGSARNVYGAMITIYTAFTAHFLVIANLNYIPPYFTFFSVPFYTAFIVFRHRRC